MATDKEKKICPKIVASLLSYDQKTGKLYWVNRDGNANFNARYAGREAFTCVERKGYLNGRLNGVNLKAHRVAWCIHYGFWPESQIDHINGDKADNRIDNLRVVDNDVNCRNQTKPRSNTSGWIGVSYHKRYGNWAAKYRNNYKDHHVGYFNCPTSAHIALLKARQGTFHENHGR